MRRLDVNITIGDKSFTWVKSLEIRKSRETLTDTATIEVPRKVNFGGKIQDLTRDKVFKRGDEVSIKIGYFPDLKERFTGYVKEISPGFITKIELEDEAYLLKQETVTKSFKKVTVKELLEEISPLPFETIDADLGQLRLTRVTPAQVLEKLKSTYKLRSWVQDGTLKVGLLYSETASADPVKFRKEYNIIEDSLTWREPGEQKVKIKGVGIAPDNKKVEYETPGEGDITLTRFYNVQSEKLLKEAVERDLETLDFSGYSGDFLTFGVPEVEHSAKVEIENLKEGHKGEYFVKSLTISFGLDMGYRQRVELDRKAD